MAHRVIHQHQTELDSDNVNYSDGSDSSFKRKSSNLLDGSPVKLVDAGEVTKEIPSILLEWSDITYTVVKKGKNGIKNVPILNGVSGYANPGELLVLMGSSGAGKTTLLNFLCNRITSAGQVEFSGTITANGTNIKDTNYLDHIGYVTQEDLMMSTMTCREVLEFAASLKVAGTKEYRKKVVEDMIDHLQITKAADTIIGSQFIKGISGGERKRVAIGVELISDPSVLFLDEPTSGLDGYTADLIVDLLRKEAQEGRTIIATLHQPSYNMYKNFQRLILLFEGNIAYQGPAKKSRRYFASIGYATPKLINPPDYYMEILHIVSRSHKTEEETKRLKHITSAYEESKSTYYCPNSNFNSEENSLPALSTLSHRYKASLSDQFKFNLYRNFKHTARDPMLLKVLISQSITQIAIYDIIWNNPDTSYTGIQSRIGFMFNFFLTVLFQCVQPIALTCNFYLVPIERELYFKEEASGLYNLFPYFLSKQIAIFPLHIIIPIIMAVGVYWVTGLTDTAEQFFIFSKIYTALIMVISSFTGASYGFLGGIIFPTPKEADQGAPILIVPWMLFAGMFSTNESLPFSFDWIKYISVRFM